MPHFAELADGLRRIVAPNPSMMTGPGTNTYLIGKNEIAVIDPGPLLPDHIADIRDKAGGDIRWILATHSHPDHSPGVARLAEMTGAEVLGMPAPNGEHQDKSFRPTRVLSDGDKLETNEFVIEAIHTPGHASNHLCYRHAATNWIITGDHVIDGATVVIDPPDGNMNDYLRSLHRLKSLDLTRLAPGHGDLLDDPDGEIDWIVEHRMDREARVVASLSVHHEKTHEELVGEVYTEVDPHLHPVAARSLLAHLIRLEAAGTARETGSGWVLTSGSIST